MSNQKILHDSGISRSCGDCTECCMRLNIDDSQLIKPAGIECTNVLRNAGCSIYSRRPMTCKNYKCGWLYFTFIDENLRPDISLLLIDINSFSPLSVSISAKTHSALELTTPEALLLIATLFTNGFIVNISIPSRPGHTACNVHLSESLTEKDLESEWALRNKVLHAIAYSKSVITDPVERYILCTKY